MQRLLSLTLYLFALTTGPVWAAESEVLAHIEKQIDTCINNNNNSLSHPEDCNASAEKSLLKSPDAATLVWDFAGIIRRKLGNHVSLQYYQRGLQNKVTPERCIDDGLDNAVKYGLGLPAESYPSQVKLTQQIVFKYCWAEWKEEIIAMSEDGTSSMWLDNVCRGAQTINAQTLIAKCH